MALMMPQPQGRQRHSPRTKQAHRDRPRNKLRHKRRDDRQPVLRGQEWSEHAEWVIGRCATSERLRLVREPDYFPTGRTARGDRRTKPDFRVLRYRDDWLVYLEVTTGQTYDKAKKIAGAERIASDQGLKLVIVLIDEDTVLALQDQDLTLRGLIDEALAERHDSERQLAA